MAIVPMGCRLSYTLQEHQCSPGLWSSLGRRRTLLPVNYCPCRVVSTSGSSLWGGFLMRIFCWQPRWWKGVLIPSNLSRFLVSPLASPFGVCIRAGNSLLFLAESGSASIDLSKATRLKDVDFRIGAKSGSVDRITMALRTITPEHRDLRQISIHVHFAPAYASVVVDVRQIVGEGIFGRWLDLDLLLVQTWESFSIRPKVIYVMPTKGGREMRDSIGYLLPEVTKRGITGLVEAYTSRSMW